MKTEPSSSSLSINENVFGVNVWIDDGTLMNGGAIDAKKKIEPFHIRKKRNKQTPLIEQIFD